MSARLIHPLPFFGAFVATGVLGSATLWLGIEKWSSDAVIAANVGIRVVGHLLLAGGVVVGLVRWKKKGAALWTIAGTLLCATMLSLRAAMELS